MDLEDIKKNEEPKDETLEVEDTDETADIADEGEDETVVMLGDDVIGDEEEPEEEDEGEAPSWVKKVRENNRELVKEKKQLAKEKRELEERINALSEKKEVKPLQLAPKPTIEDCDFDHEVYDKKLDAWYSEKTKYDAEQQKVQAVQAEAAKAWQGRLDNYAQAKTALKLKDYSEAEEVVQGILSKTQQGLILDGADNPALVVYAIGKNPKLAKEIAAETNPVKFAFAIAKLETRLKTTTKKTAPKPESKVRGSGGSSSGAISNELEKLRNEAAKTGDYSKVHAYNRSKKKKET